MASFLKTQQPKHHGASRAAAPDALQAHGSSFIQVSVVLPCPPRQHYCDLIKPRHVHAGWHWPLNDGDELMAGQHVFRFSKPEDHIVASRKEAADKAAADKEAAEKDAAERIAKEAASQIKEAEAAAVAAAQAARHAAQAAHHTAMMMRLDAPLEIRIVTRMGSVKLAISGLGAGEKLPTYKSYRLVLEKDKFKLDVFGLKDRVEKPAHSRNFEQSIESKFPLNVYPGVQCFATSRANEEAMTDPEFAAKGFILECGAKKRLFVKATSELEREKWLRAIEYRIEYLRKQTSMEGESP